MQFSERLHFSGIKVLDEFEWYSCRRRQLRTVQRWIADDEFPPGENSDTVIRNLWDGEFGSRNKRYCQDFIIPNANRVLVISMTWNPRQPPNGNFFVEASRGDIEGDLGSEW